MNSTSNCAAGLVATAMLLSGCASSYRPIVDMKPGEEVRYSQDLVECQRYTQQISPEGHAAAGAIVGALLGAALGAAVGNRDIAQRVAGVGAISGGASGAAQGMQTQVDIIRNCMRGRGYNVLN